MSDHVFPTILIADDQAGQRAVLDMLLTLDGYEVVAKEDGRETLEYLQDHTPGLIILDINMPHMNGIEICTRIKRIKRLNNVPVVILTGLKDEKILTEARLAKADRVIHKPLEGKDFREVVKDLLRQSKEASLAAEAKAKAVDFSGLPNA